MKLPPLTTETIQQHTSGGSYDRGQEYFQSGAVRALRQREKGRIEALVQGGDVLPYTVEIQFDEGGVTGVQCTCPYFAGSWCKHIVATLLACLHQAQQEAPPASVTALLSELDRDALITLVERLVAREPELGDWITREYAPDRLP